MPVRLHGSANIVSCCSARWSTFFSYLCRVVPPSQIHMWNAVQYLHYDYSNLWRATTTTEVAFVALHLARKNFKRVPELVAMTQKLDLVQFQFHLFSVRLDNNADAWNRKSFANSDHPWLEAVKVTPSPPPTWPSYANSVIVHVNKRATTNSVPG